MRFIFGGKGQGKLEYAKRFYDGEPLVCDLKDCSLDDALSADILLNVQEAVRIVLLSGGDPTDYFRARLEKLGDKTLIGDEIGCGVVPADPLEREWRDQTGWVYQFLVSKADRVDRVFAGIGQTLKRAETDRTENPVEKAGEARAQKHCVHLYFGDGKGKTTAALGLGLRAWGRGQRVLLAQFLKGFDSGEILALEHLGENFCILQDEPVKKFVSGMSEGEKVAAARVQHRMFARAAQAGAEGRYDMFLFDELVDAIGLGMVPFDEVRDFIRENVGRSEIVITGHRPQPELLALCDYVTEMKKLRHPYDRGVSARIGVEK